MPVSGGSQGRAEPQHIACGGEGEIVREGDSIILRPVRPTWGSFFELEKADPDFMAEREDVFSDEGRF